MARVTEQKYLLFGISCGIKEHKVCRFLIFAVCVLRLRWRFTNAVGAQEKRLKPLRMVLELQLAEFLFGSYLTVPYKCNIQTRKIAKIRNLFLLLLFLGLFASCGMNIEYCCKEFSYAAAAVDVASVCWWQLFLVILRFHVCVCVCLCNCVACCLLLKLIAHFRSVGNNKAIMRKSCNPLVAQNRKKSSTRLVSLYFSYFSESSALSQTCDNDNIKITHSTVANILQQTHSAKHICGKLIKFCRASFPLSDFTGA